MSLSRSQRRLLALKAVFQSGRNKPPTRKQARAWLDPIRNAFNEIKSGEVDSYRGYAITRIHWTDEDFARVDFCINGFTAMLDRLVPEFDSGPMKRVSRKLSNGVLLTHDEVEACFVVLNRCEDMLIKHKRADLIAASVSEQINIELDRLKLKEAA